jgi:hypothetical protein
MGGVPVDAADTTPRPTRAERVAARRRRQARTFGTIVLVLVLAFAAVVAFAISRGDDHEIGEGGDPAGTAPANDVTPTSSRAPAGSPTTGSSETPAVDDNGPVPVPASGAYFGTWRGPGPGRSTSSAQNLADAEDDVGRQYAIDRRFYRWGTDLPTEYDRDTADAGRIPMISLRSRDHDTDEYIPWADIAAGGQDEYIEHIARNFEEWDQPMFFIFDAEPESQLEQSGSPEDFVAAWRHIAAKFDDAGADRVSFMFTTTAYSFTPESGQAEEVASMYPGDDVVDWIASDPYNFFKDGDWIPLSDEIQPWYVWATGNHPSKPLAFSEWGSKEDPDDPNRKAAWFHEALDSLRTQYPGVKAVVYFDERKEERGTVNDWRIDTSSESLAAFKAIAADPYFHP